jgi:TPR repeat protein
VCLFLWDGYYSNLLSNLYFNFSYVGVEKDEQKGISFMERSANHGYSGAYNDLGYVYECGSATIAKDYNQARKYYKAAALKGD